MINKKNNGSIFAETVKTNYQMYKEEVERRNKLKEGWERTTLLKGVKDDRKDYMAQLLENAKTSIITSNARTVDIDGNGLIKEGTSTGNVDVWTGVTLPLVRRVFNQLAANELVNVQAMSAPSGFFFYINPTWGNDIYAADGASTLYTAGQSIYGVPFDDDFESRFPFASMLNNYSRNQHLAVVDVSESTGKVTYEEATLADFRWQKSSIDKTVSKTIADSSSVDHLVTWTYKPIKMKIYTDATTNKVDGADKAVTLDALKVDLNSVSGFTIDNDHIGSLYMDYTTYGTDDTGTYIQFIFDPVVTDDEADTITVGGYTVTTPTAANLADEDVNYAGTIAMVANTSIPDAKLMYSDTSFENSPRTYEAGVGQSHGNASTAEQTYDVFSPRPLPNEINIEITREQVETQGRRLKMIYTQEAVDDVKAYHSLDLQKEVVNAASEVISLEMDREIIEMLINTAVSNKYINFWSLTQGMEYDKEASNFRRTAFLGTQQDWYQTLIQTINITSKEIGRRAGRNDATFIVASPEICAILESIPGYSVSTIDTAQKGNAGFVNNGTLKNKWEIYQYNYMRNNVILLGFRGTDKDLSAGAYFCPYIPLQFTPNMTDMNTMANIIGARTRYGKKVIRPEFYALIWIAKPSLSALPTT